MLCDFAEFYHIVDLEALPVEKLAALSFGLPQKSRTMRKISGCKLTTDEMLLAVIADRVTTVAWMLSEDGRRGRNRPKSILSELLNPTETEKPIAFTNGLDFLTARENILKGGD